jgi:uncharacterized BrkB/YihY/UPF0761 family membrane protein
MCGMQSFQGLLRLVDRVQQRSRWLGFPFAVMRKFADDHGGALTTVIAYNAFFALFPLLLVVVTVLGFLLGRDSGFQQRLLDSAVAEFPIIGQQVRDNVHGLRGSGLGLVVGLVAFAWGARGLTQVAQHAMAEIWNIPGRQRPGFWARQVRGLLLLVVFAVGLAATSLLTWLGSYGGKAVAVALANLVAAAAVNVGLFLLVFRVLTPQQIPTRQLLAGALVAGVAWQALQAAGGYLVDHYLRHTSQVYGCSRSSLACCSGCIWAHSSPCTPPRSTSSPPDGSGREACCNRRSPTPNRPPSTLPTSSDTDPEKATSETRPATLATGRLPI